MPTLERLDVEAVRAIVAGFASAVRAHTAALNRLNVYPVPDGDTGTNMSRTLDTVVAELEQAPADDLVASCKAISHGSLMGARGNSGVILSQILRGLASAFERSGGAGPVELAAGLDAAATAAYAAVLRPIEGTILSVARGAADAAVARAGDGADLVGVVTAARDAGAVALAFTPEQLPVLKQAGVVDAGGAGFLLLLHALLEVVDGTAVPEPEVVDGPVGDVFAAVAHRAGSGDSAVDVSELRYEVMYFLDLADEHIDTFKSAWGAIGDSIVVVGGEGLWNCHVHTNDIGAAIEAGLGDGGRPSKIRVTDLFEEVDDEHRAREVALGVASSASGGQGASRAASFGLPPVTTAVVAVASGQGLTELFGHLHVQGVVTGGQTMNPSTAELLAAVEAVNAQQVILLPNNKNIIAVAEQVDTLTAKHVVVVPTRAMPEALAALVVYDPEESAEVNAAAMAAAIDGTVTGEVTQAVRDSASDAGPVTTGDWIGIVRGEGIVAVAGSLTAAALSLLDHLVTDDHEIVTVIVGADATRERTSEVLAWLAEQRPNCEVEVHGGGQPLYPYLFGAE